MIILETKRFFLRELVPADAESMFALNLDPEVVRYTGDGPFESIETARKFLENYPDYRKNGYGRWLVVRKSDDEIMGWCGLKFHPETGETDLGYRFFKKYWGQGIATEAALGCLAYGFEVLQLPAVIAQAMKANPASVRVMEKIGMTFWKDDDCGSAPGVCYIIDRSAYQNAHKAGNVVSNENLKQTGGILS